MIIINTIIFKVEPDLRTIQFMRTKTVVSSELAIGMIYLYNQLIIFLLYSSVQLLYKIT